MALLRRHGIELRPSFLPFTPWTTLDDVVDLLDFVADHDLVANVDPVQYTIRLLVPEGSLLEPIMATEARLGPYDPERLTYTWSAGDPAVDDLQTDLAAMVEGAQTAGEPIGRIYGRVRAAVHAAAGRHPAGDGLDVARFGAAARGRRRREATAHRAVVLLSGADRGPVRPSPGCLAR